MRRPGQTALARGDAAAARGQRLPGRGPVRLNFVHVQQPQAPDQAEPLEWFLLTTPPVASTRQAEQVLDWYRLRWRIEDWPRILKAGC